MAQGRFRSLDGLRGAAAAIVVLHHIALTLPATADGYRAIDDSGAPWWARILVNSPMHLLWQGTEAVYLFFILSGFVLTLPWLRRKGSWRQYYGARLARLYLPVWASLVIATVLVVTFYPASAAGRTWWLQQHVGLAPSLALKDALLVLGVSNINSPLWSLQWEVLFSLLLPLYLFLMRFTRGPRRAVIGIVVLILATAAGKAVHLEALQFLPIFGLGVILAANADELESLRTRVARFRWATPALLVGSLLLLNLEWILRGFPHVPIALLAGARLGDLVASCVLLWIGLTAPPAKRVLETTPLQWLGTRSFSLYLVHEPVVVTLAFTLGKVSPAGAALLAIPVALLLAEAFYRVVERPSHLVSRALGKRLAPPVRPVADELPGTDRVELQ